MLPGKRRRLFQINRPRAGPVADTEAVYGVFSEKVREEYFFSTEGAAKQAFEVCCV